MPNTDRPRVFISAVTREFGACRSNIANNARKLHLSPDSQDTCGPSGRDLVARLMSQVQAASAVVCLVGRQFGIQLSAACAQTMHHEPALHAAGYPGAAELLSYTQLECLLAIGSDKPTYVFMPSERYLSVDPTMPTTDPKQAMFVSWLRQSGHYFTEFDNEDQLLRGVVEALVDATMVAGADQGTVQHVVSLPTRSLGALFLGREKTIAHMGRVLASDSGPAVSSRVVVLSGPPLIGKSRIAVEYAWAQCEVRNVIVAVPARTGVDVSQGIADLVYRLPESASCRHCGDWEYRAACTRTWLAAHPGWMLLFDDVDSLEAQRAVLALVPRLVGGSIIITSRLAMWPRECPVIEVDALPEAAAAAYLRAAIPPDGQPDGDRYARLAQALGRIPRVLELVSAAANRFRWTIDECLLRWQHSREALLAMQGDPGNCESLVEACRRSIDAANERSRRLLGALAWLGHAPVPVASIEAVGAESAWSHALPGSRHAMVSPSCEALAELAGLSIIRWEAGFVRVDAVMQGVARAAARVESDAGQSDAVRIVAHCLKGAPQGTLRRAMLMPHLEAVATCSDTPEIRGDLASILTAFGIQCRTQGALMRAEAAFQRALELDIACHGAHHPDIADDLNNLGTLYRAMGKCDQAEALLVQAVECILATRETNDNKYVLYQSNRVECLRAMGRYEEALSIANEVVCVTTGWSKAEPERYAHARYNRGAVLRELERHREARADVCRALHAERDHHGADSARLRHGWNNLAKCLEGGGWYAMAERAYCRALTLFLSCGEVDSPGCATVMNNLGVLLSRRGRAGRGEEALVNAHAIDVNVWPDGSAERLRDGWTLAEHYERYGDLERARQVIGATGDLLARGVAGGADVVRHAEMVARVRERLDAQS